MAQIKHYYLVDMENVGLQGLCGLNMPGADSAVVIFLSNSAHVATEEIQADILASKAEIDTFFCSVTGKNALDFEVAAYFGAILEREDVERISIISNDGGYRSLEDYAKKVRKKVTVYQGKTILEAFVTAQHVSGPKMYKKGKPVDFKHVMEALKKKREFEEPIRSGLSGLLEESEIESALSIYQNADSPRGKYLELMKSFGRAKGTEIYRVIRGADA